MHKFIIFALSCFSVQAYETGQLPLSDDVARTFPKIKSNCYIIVNEETGVVVTEKNSNAKIETGTFVNEYGGAKLMSLMEMSRRVKNCEVKFFRSDMSGVGGACKFKNKFGAYFVCVIYGEQSNEEVLQDIDKITEWINQFYIYKISNNQHTKYIPIIYGKNNNISVDVNKSKLILLSKHFSKHIEKVYRYRTLIKAPVRKSDKVGYILYYTSIYKNPIIEVLYANEEVQKKPWYKCISDSIVYIILGTSMRSISE